MSQSAPIQSIPERIESDNVEAVMDQLVIECEQVDCADSLVLDFTALKQFDSSALSMLLEVSRRRGAPVRVINPPAKLAELAEIYGVNELLLGQNDTESDAI